MPAIGRQVKCDFTQGRCDLFKEPEGQPPVKYDDKDGAQIVIESERDEPMIFTSDYMLFGQVEIELKAMGGQGLVTFAFLQSLYSDAVRPRHCAYEYPTDDEWLVKIDLEWLGVKGNEFETSYFAKGNAWGLDQDGNHTIHDTTGSFHTYTVKWTARSISWSVDGEEVRVEGRNPRDEGDTYPQTPAQIKIGAWVAGTESAPNGTVEWAGGLADLSDGPFTASIRSVTVVDYAGGDEMPKKRTKEYESTNRNGTYQSIKVVETDEDNEDPTTTTISSSSGGTSAPSETGSPAGESESTGSRNQDSNPKSRGLAAGAIAGIVVGSIAAIALAFASWFFCWRRKRRPQVDSSSSQPEVLKAELHGKSMEGWRSGQGPPVEMDGSGKPLERCATDTPQELHTAEQVAPVEMEASHVQRYA